MPLVGAGRADDLRRENAMMEEEGQISDLFKRYLYSDLNAVERDELEDRLFAEAEFAELLEDFENDLVDSYLRGELTVSEKDDFETRYLVSKSHRGKTTVARILHNRTVAATQPHSAVAPPEHGFWRAIVGAWRNRNIALASGLAAAVLVGTGIWLYRSVNDDRMAKTGNLNTIVNTNENPGDSVSNGDNSIVVTAQNGERIDDRSAPEPGPSFPPPPPADEPDRRRGQPRVFAFTLLPATRSSARPVIQISRSANSVLLTLVHNDQREFLGFKVELGPTGAEATWRRDITAPKRSGSSAVVVSIPASELIPGAYEIALAGVMHDGQIEDLQFYQFSVRK